MQDLVFTTDEWSGLPEVADEVKDSLVLNHFPVGIRVHVNQNSKQCEVDIKYLKQYSDDILATCHYVHEDFSCRIQAYGSLSNKIISRITMSFGSSAILPNHFMGPINSLLDDLNKNYASKLSKENHNLLSFIFDKVIFSITQNKKFFSLLSKEGDGNLIA